MSRIWPPLNHLRGQNRAATWGFQGLYPILGLGKEDPRTIKRMSQVPSNLRSLSGGGGSKLWRPIMVSCLWLFILYPETKAKYMLIRTGRSTCSVDRQQ